MLSLLNTQVLSFKILFINCAFQLTLHKGKLQQNSCLRSCSTLQTNDRARKYIKILTPFQVSFLLFVFFSGTLLKIFLDIKCLIPPKFVS